ncbi:hypothetical protein FOCC_FOCC016385 [Frankliniella occidentalis]|nr:hypothetical protein FOCC_FOCC016385 [Frankliniella occidentalis]
MAEEANQIELYIVMKTTIGAPRIVKEALPGMFLKPQRGFILSLGRNVQVCMAAWRKALRAKSGRESKNILKNKNPSAPANLCISGFYSATTLRHSTSCAAPKRNMCLIGEVSHVILHTDSKAEAMQQSQARPSTLTSNKN